MSTKITVTLGPDANQSQQLLDTMTRYHELCNYISQLTVEQNYSRPIHLKDWRVDNSYDNLYHQVRGMFPDVNSNMITLAFRKVSQSYSKTKTITEPLQFGGDVDFNSYMVSFLYVTPSPNNIGVISISTLAGLQNMRFELEDAQRKYWDIALSFKKYCEYKLSNYEGIFYLSRNLGDSKIKTYRQKRQRYFVPV